MKKNRGWLTYVIVVGVFLMIAVMAAGGLTPRDRTLTYAELWEKIEAGEVKSVAIRGTNLWGLYKESKVREDKFPEDDYDFETTIADRESFLQEAFKLEANRRNAEMLAQAEKENADPEGTEQGAVTASVTPITAEQISEKDLGFTVIPLPPLTIPWWYDLIPFVIMLVLLAGFWFLMFRSQSGGNGKVMNFGKSRARVADPSKNKITFDDVAGAEEEKEELQ